MGYIEENLVSGESVLYKTRLHWIVLIWPLIGGVLLYSLSECYARRHNSSRR